MVDYRQRNMELLNRVAARLRAIYAQAARQAALIGATIRKPRTDKTFSLDHYPAVRAKIDKLIADLHARTQAVVVDGIREAWNLAEEQNAELVRKYLGGDITDAQVQKYFGGTSAALEAFLVRKAGGLGLSDRVWNYSSQYRDEIETALGVGISNGDSAAKMARDLKGYLKYPDKLFRRVRDNNGVLRLSKPARLFHPGQGVYRSSFANARRLAVNETNMAYHTADYERWQSLDFVVGIKVTPSGSHPCPDICDQLAGYYPKDFKFTGWHPQCLCHATTVLKTREEMAGDTRRILGGRQTVNWSRRSVTSVPDGFAAWVRENEGKIHAAKSRPYFVNDNIAFVRGVLLGKDEAAYAEEVASGPLGKDEFEGRMKYLDMAVKNNYLPQSAVDEIQRIEEMGNETDAQIRARLNALDMQAYHNAVNPNPDIARMNAVQAEVRKQPIKDIDDVSRIMNQYYDQYPEEFNHHRVEFTTYNEPREKGGSYISGKSSHDKFIGFNVADDKGSGSWFDTIKQAFNAVRDNQPLTGGELNAIRTIQHEMLHQKAKEWEKLPPESKSYQRFAMELMNELGARAKFPEFLSRLGGDTTNAKSVMRDSPAYKESEDRLLGFIDKAGLDPFKVGDKFADVVTTEPYSTMEDYLYKFMKDHVEQTGNKDKFTQSKDEVLSALADKKSSAKWNEYMQDWFGQTSPSKEYSAG